MHGNNKSEAELRRAVEAGVGHVICDSLAEIDRLDAICAAAGRRQQVLIRVTPGVKADTHSYVQTGQLDSKFGLGLADGLAAAGSRRRSAPTTSSWSGCTLTSARRSSSSSHTSARSRRSPSSPTPPGAGC